MKKKYLKNAFLFLTLNTFFVYPSLSFANLEYKKTIFSLVANIVKCDQKKRFHTTLTFKIRDVERTISEYFIKYESVEFSIYVPENMNILFREICHSPLVNPSFLNDWDILDIKDNRANITKIFSYKDNPDFIIFVREN